jgi:FkbM family methyltransferase
MFFRKQKSYSEAREFATLLCKSVLNRDPDPEGIDFFADKLMKGMTELELLKIIVASDEYREKSLNLTYRRDIAEDLIDILFDKKINARFIQVGVNDAKNDDFIRTRALKNNWQGLMIEPHPTYIKMAQHNYQYSQNMIWENVAISNTNENKDLYFVENPSQDKPGDLGLASFDIEHIKKHGLTETEISSVTVPCQPLKMLIDKHNYYKSDLLVIDVEGHELSVIESIDFSKFSCHLIVVETRHMKKEAFDLILNILPDNYKAIYHPHYNDSVIYNCDWM